MQWQPPPCWSINFILAFSARNDIHRIATSTRWRCVGEPCMLATNGKFSIVTLPKDLCVFNTVLRALTTRTMMPRATHFLKSLGRQAHDV